MATEDFTILGAGLVGSLLAVVLRQKGYTVAVYERYQDIRSIPALGRSINLVLTSRGLRSVALLGEKLLQDMLSFGIPTLGRILHQTDGSQQFQAYGRDDSEHNYSISRFELNKFLLRKAAEAGAVLHFQHEVKNLDLDAMTLTVNVGGVSKTVKTGRIIGCDGGGSAARYAMQRAGATTFEEIPLSHGYKEVIFPKAPFGGPCMSMKGLHIWPRGHHMLMGLANLDGSFTGTLYCPNQGEDSFKELSTPDKVTSFFKTHYSDAIDLAGGEDSLAKQVIGNPTGFLGTVRCSKWNYKGRCLLLGDASHAIVPFFGQGCNSGFEDVRVFAQHLDKYVTHINSDSQVEACFEAFNLFQRPNANAIADMALDNFVEMCSRVGDPQFLLKKQVEQLLENRFPHKYRSRYAMTCYGGFGNVTYHAAITLGRVQHELLSQIVANLQRAQDVDLKQAEALIDAKLVPVQKQLKVDLLTVSHEVHEQKRSSL
mmetsp:Transcript_20478/g.40545  ORF Transcript_20478/g.40545 Transcript_20478/m.40545 type:complete len:484 (-) Transcript_20478:126-1577(-)|eukprot:CAMPEP_0175149078 /NCGR_PEP_ID=MMETSP0087-20121206/17021_1 /TAXON_ID=136419 /ORGANISM="Unknown Unknown, Strain D1" /LENGTH=483 /DNA_ID=CAMNT_0016434685 /DNA_START=33 /DNA_END=1484 /DNA_ORIENTATION=-